MDSQETLHHKPLSFENRISPENGIAVDKRIGYNYETKRMKSFESWPVHYPIDPSRLAKSGFYYEGKDDEVTCFSCHGKIRDWQFGDVVQKKHAELYPECDFIKRRSNNVPANFKMNGVGKRHANDHIAPNHSKSPPSATVSSEASLRSMNGVSTSTETDRNPPDFEKMKSEEERVKTYSNGWPLSFIKVAEVAKAGFFYLGYEDKVQCAFCKGTVKDWENGDIPLAEHAKHFPWCGYLHSIGYTTLKSMQGTPWHKVTGLDICGSLQAPDSPIKKSKLLNDDVENENLKKLGIHFYKGPAHPQHAPLPSRIRSFLTWPMTAPVTKEDLALAGFFYIGLSDHTKCYHCGGGLCNWEKGDDPWFEHARWFPKCDFVRLTKGEDFIEACKEAHITTPSLTSGMNSSAPSTCPSIESLMAKVDETMKSSLIEHIVESKIYPYNVVHSAVLQQIKETGTPFTSVDEVCKAIAYLTEKMECESTKVAERSLSSPSVPQLNNVLPGSVLQDMPIPGVSTLQFNSNVVEKKTVKSSEGSSLAQENKVLRDQCLCKVCMDKEVGIVFLPCGHLLTCTQCAPALKICPMCRKTIQATVRAYLP